MSPARVLDQHHRVYLSVAAAVASRNGRSNAISACSILMLPPPAGLYRIVTDEGDGRTWLASADYQRIAVFKKPAVGPKPSLFSSRLPGKTWLVDAVRVGRGKLRLPAADA